MAMVKYAYKNVKNMILVLQKLLVVVNRFFCYIFTIKYPVQMKSFYVYLLLRYTFKKITCTSIRTPVKLDSLS